MFSNSGSFYLTGLLNYNGRYGIFTICTVSIPFSRKMESKLCFAFLGTSSAHRYLHLLEIAETLERMNSFSDQPYRQSAQNRLCI